MDAPSVQFARTHDGYDIAYAGSGKGRPFVLLPQPISHIQLYWTEDTWVRPWLEGLASRFKLVQYDGRGQGMSTRGLKEDTVLEDLQTDLETILDRAGLERFVLMGVQPFGHVAIRYAAAHPHRVDALVLVSCPVSMAAWPLGQLGRSTQDWGVMLRAQAGLSQAPDVGASVERQKKAISQSDYEVLAALTAGSSVAGLLGGLQTPALVLHPRDSLNLAPEESMKLAAAIPNARMVLIKGATPLGDAEEGLRAIDAFLAELLEVADEGPDVAVASPTGLSLREVEVLRLLAAGRSNQQIADDLVISPNTVRRHVSNIFDKTGVANRAQAAVYARDNGLA
jgi:DNA-binding CsgD family transcriptional regulator/pimeloyl-ACP methyl ester carboxylesterase